MKDQILNLKLPLSLLPLCQEKKQCFSARYDRPSIPKLQKRFSLDEKLLEAPNLQNVNKKSLLKNACNSNFYDSNIRTSNNNIDSDQNAINNESINDSNGKINHLDSNSAFEPPQSPKNEEFDLSINTDISDIIEKDEEDKNNLLKELDSYHEKITSPWKELELIGCGSFGQVVKAVEFKTGRIFAVKKINTNLDWGVNQMTLKEIKARFL